LWNSITFCPRSGRAFASQPPATAASFLPAVDRQPRQLLGADQLEQLLAEQRPVDALLEVVETRVEVARVLGRRGLEGVGDVLGEQLRAHRIQPEVRVALRMNVTLGARERGRNFELRDARRQRHAAGTSFEYARVTRSGGDLVGPQLQLHPDLEQHVGAAHALHQRRRRRHEVGILIAGRKTESLDAIAPHLAHQRFDGRERARDLLFRIGVRRGRAERQRQQDQRPTQ